MMVGLPSALTSARLLPATSPLTFANFFACSRQILAGAASNPDGPGVSSSFLRKVIDSAEIMLSEFRGGPPRVTVSAARVKMYSNGNKNGRLLSPLCWITAPAMIHTLTRLEFCSLRRARSLTCTAPDAHEKSLSAAARIVPRDRRFSIDVDGASCRDLGADYRCALRSHLHPS